MSKRIKLTETDSDDSDYIESDVSSESDILDIIEADPEPNSGMVFNIGDIHINYGSFMDGDYENYEECGDCEEGEEPEKGDTPYIIPVDKPNLIDEFKLNIGIVNNLKDLIFVLDNSEATDSQRDLLSVCRELDSLIGMTDLKNKITTQIVSIIQGLVQKGTLLNTILTGNPGVGKTRVIHIIAKIYKSLGYLKTNKITVANRSSLIAGYLGQTGAKTTAVLNSALGGVLVIDEVYSLYTAKGDMDDQYGRECIDTINQYLTEHPELICIVAGYANDVENHFIKINQGLSRRFTYKFNIDNYNSDELCDIFYDQLASDYNKWTLTVDKDYVLKLITKNFTKFKSNGADMREVLDKSKLLYARRAFNEKIKTFIITGEDLVSAIETMVSMKHDNSDDCGFCRDLAKAVKETRDCKNCNKSLRSYIS
jgi:hypothetical protein